jgi:hypothetical protein
MDRNAKLGRVGYTYRTHGRANRAHKIVGAAIGRDGENGNRRLRSGTTEWRPVTCRVGNQDDH